MGFARALDVVALKRLPVYGSPFDFRQMIDDGVRDLIRGHKVAKTLKGLQGEKKTESGTLAPHNRCAKITLFRCGGVPSLQFAGIKTGFETGIGCIVLAPVEN